MIKAVLFDFDGVIIDSYEANVFCYQGALAYLKYPIPSKKTIISLLGHTAVEIVKKLLPHATQKQRELVVQRVYYESDRSIPYIRLIAGAKSVLSVLERKYKRSIVSNRRHISINKILDHLKLQTSFDFIVGKEDVQFPKPHPEPLLKALTHFHLKSQQAIYVGDMKEDILAAKAASVASIFIAGERQDAYGADYVIKTIQDFPALFKKLL